MAEEGKAEAGEVIEWDTPEGRVKAWDRQAIVTAIKAMSSPERTLLLIDVVEDSSALGQCRAERDAAQAALEVALREKREAEERRDVAMHDVTVLERSWTADRGARDEMCRQRNEAQRQLASERAGREQAVADARRIHYLGNVIRARSQVEQDELTRLMRKYPPLVEATPAPPSEGPASPVAEDAHPAAKSSPSDDNEGDFPPFGDPGDSVALEKLRMVIDDNLIWPDDATLFCPACGAGWVGTPAEVAQAQKAQAAWERHEHNAHAEARRG